MPPKRREKENDLEKSMKVDGSQGDHEQFLQAFEKPTQIYRYLRTRNMLKPVFLWRTLTYMRHRMSRTNRMRKNFKVDSILSAVSSKISAPPTGYLTLTFLGFYNKTCVAQLEPVKLETVLLKICHKKRKEVACPALTVSLGTSYIPFNPSEECPPPKAPTVSIPAETFKLTGHLVKSYHLLLRVSTMANNIISINSDETETTQKKRKYSKAISDEEKVVIYGTDVVIYDKQNRLLLTDGYYEFYLNTLQGPEPKITTSLSSWEDMGIDKELREQHLPSFEKLSAGPMLKVKLLWTREPVTPMVDRPSCIVPKDIEAMSNKSSVVNGENESVPRGIEHGLSVVYQFLYNSNSKQQTDASSDMHCPWCSIDCKNLYSLLKHLKLCHPRFTFKYVPVQGGVRIDVSLNEGYDGSYWGPLGQMPRGSGPVRRSPLSYVIVCHPKRPNINNLSEFLDMDESEFDTQRALMSGHTRLYHHTTTCLPIINPKELDVDSEDETDPRWLQKKTMMMIDEFTDVNEGEKELMKMWNLHIMRHGSKFVGDCRIPEACSMFLLERGQELLSKNLYRNFVLHMCNLFDFGLVSSLTLFTIMQDVQKLIESDMEINGILQESWQAQREHWNAVEQKPWLDELAAARSPAGGNIGDSGQRRKPTSEKKPCSPKKVTGDKRRHPDARRRLSLPNKPELRRKVLKEASASPLRRRSFNGEPPTHKRKLENGS